jgi:nucleotide-binding universal stress UspA family protein
MYDRILVPTDGSTGTAHVALQAFDLAERYGATVYALHVIDTDLIGSCVSSFRTGYQFWSLHGLTHVYCDTRAVTNHARPYQATHSRAVADQVYPVPAARKRTTSPGAKRSRRRPSSRATIWSTLCMCPNSSR